MIVQGIVTKGHGAAGPIYGFPTANVVTDKDPCLTMGVYVGHVILPDQADKLPCVICYGVGEEKLHLKFEVHIFDWQGDLYGKKITVEVGKMINGITPFFGINEIRSKIQRDLKTARETLGI